MRCATPQRDQDAAVNCPEAVSFCCPQRTALSLWQTNSRPTFPEYLSPLILLYFFFSLQQFPVLVVLIPTCMYLCGFFPLLIELQNSLRLSPCTFHVYFAALLTQLASATVNS